MLHCYIHHQYLISILVAAQGHCDSYDRLVQETVGCFRDLVSDVAFSVTRHHHVHTEIRTKISQNAI